VSTRSAVHVHISLVEVKTKVAPIKKVSLPRLELCGAHFVARLVKHLKAVLEIPTKDISMLIYTDSTIVGYCIGYMEPVNG
jgi:glutamine synthetase